MMSSHAPAGEESRLRKFLQWLISWAKSFLMALVIVLVLTVLVFQIIGVDGTSMANTLADGERLFVAKYPYVLGDPERFDVVICNYPERGSTKFVKRIVGVPGDTVAVYEGLLYINGEPVHEEYIDYPPYYMLPETQVEQGHYFVLGDNRANSNDSHVASVGQLERRQILGRVDAVVWPFSDIRRID